MKTSVHKTRRHTNCQYGNKNILTEGVGRFAVSRQVYLDSLDTLARVCTERARHAIEVDSSYGDVARGKLRRLFWKLRAAACLVEALVAAVPALCKQNTPSF